ncbi:cation diffusion facilitator family transporter [Clostridium oryzae]|uniref:Ferrous-iron efflux pump FieF n=1 Tax=Clostridium oryzae TaxID=1450648 RepID=A0A1V4ILM5_9CLOT|nr:cation diffusion facilitator family transporter [Clostridium oryzae]OPJ60744.1 ferrous-iron efflux pump FieF [Clostridium oryzae]
MNSKTKVARLSVISNSVLMGMKLLVGLYTGSVSILSEAIHSTMDLIAAIIAFFSVRISSRPADKEHPYGHGKFENISGVIESLLIFAAAVWIIIESVNKILHPNGKVGFLAMGFIVMFISSGINFMVSRKLYKVAKQEDSIALEADALHLKTDVYTALGVGSGLLLICITKLEFLDPIVAIIVALFILKESFELLKTAFNPLLDTKLSDKEIKVIQDVIDKYSSVYCNFHNLRTRKSGSTKCVDLHLVMPENISVKSAHDICDKIEADLDSLLKNTEVMIHVESCAENCVECKYPHKINCKMASTKE